MAMKPSLTRWFSLFGDPAVAISIIAFVGYFLISRVVVNQFPFSTYSMYSRMTLPADGIVRGCHLMARGPDGVVSDVNQYTSWECPAWEKAARQSIWDLDCPLFYNVEDPIAEYLHHHATRGAAAAIPVDLVRRVWKFKGNDPASVSDHVIVSCRAVLR